ncbi:hypothetical protein YC2023_084986 [Brassica napus]
MRRLETQFYYSYIKRHINRFAAILEEGECDQCVSRQGKKVAHDHSWELMQIEKDGVMTLKFLVGKKQDLALGLNPEALAQIDLGMFLLDGKEVEPNVLGV